MIRNMVVATLGMLLMVVPLAGAQQSPSANDEKLSQDVQEQMAEAYNRQDADAMAMMFAENGVRVTPSGIFQGRDAIRRSFQDALSMGLHDYSVRRTVSRAEGSLTFNAGEWQARLGDRAFHGYYSAVLSRAGDQTRILQETVNVAPP